MKFWSATSSQMWYDLVRLLFFGSGNTREYDGLARDGPPFDGLENGPHRKRLLKVRQIAKAQDGGLLFDSEIVFSPFGDVFFSGHAIDDYPRMGGSRLSTSESDGLEQFAFALLALNFSHTCSGLIWRTRKRPLLRIVCLAGNETFSSQKAFTH